MDYQKSFTIDLVSNGSMHVYPDNTLSKFQNRIDPPLELDGDWEVALNEIYFSFNIQACFGNYNPIQITIQATMVTPRILQARTELEG